MTSKTTKKQSLSVKHFSRYGEFLASFELSKFQWDTFTPVYDEYIDLYIHKVVCKKCNSKWDTSPSLICNKCKKEVSSSNKKNIKALGICSKCKHEFSTTRLRKCPKCKSSDYNNKAGCPFGRCKGKIEIRTHSCKCGSQKFESKVRTVQVKSSNLENNGRSYAVDLRPKDLTQGEHHFYVWVCVDPNGKNNFIVISIKEFEKISKSFINSTSFLKDEGREHFSSTTFGKFAPYLNAFDKLE